MDQGVVAPAPVVQSQAPVAPVAPVAIAPIKITGPADVSFLASEPNIMNQNLCIKDLGSNTLHKIVYALEGNYVDFSDLDPMIGPEITRKWKNEKRGVQNAVKKLKGELPYAPEEGIIIITIPRKQVTPGDFKIFLIGSKPGMFGYSCFEITTRDKEHNLDNVFRGDKIKSSLTPNSTFSSVSTAVFGRASVAISKQLVNVVPNINPVLKAFWIPKDYRDWKLELVSCPPSVDFTPPNPPQGGRKSRKYKSRKIRKNKKLHTRNNKTRGRRHN